MLLFYNIVPVVQPVTRRNFARIVGTTTGIAGVSGLVSATEKEENQEEPQSNLEIAFDQAVEDGKAYTIAVARNTDTGETDASVFVNPVDSADSNKSLSKQSEERDFLDVSGDVVDSVGATVFDTEDEQKASTEGGPQSSSEDPQTDVWGPVREETKSSGISTQQESIYEDILDEISAGAKDVINEAGYYYIDSPKGTDCDAEITDQHPHRQIGASVDYDKDVGELSTTLIGTTVVAILGGVWASVPGAVVGGIIGTVVGWGASQLKDTSNFTFAFRDIDKSAFGTTDAALQPLVSGIWMDEDTDMLTYNNDLPLIYLEDSPVNPEVGTEDTFDVP
jgi:hypothetical protein